MAKTICLDFDGVTTDTEVQKYHDPVEFWNEADVVLVTQRKLPAMCYVDDRAVHFENWTQALEEVKRRYLS
jgi:hypothetical protein